MQNEAGAFSLNRPEAQAKDEYLYLWQTYEINLAHLICSSDTKFDPRIPRMVRFMISLIAHDSIRRYAETRFDEAIRYANSRKDLPLDERNEMILRICATMCGNLTAYVDQFKGLAHQLRIGELVDMSKDYYQKSIHPEAIEIGKEENDPSIELKYGEIRKTQKDTILPTLENEIEPEVPKAFALADTEGEGEQATNNEANHDEWEDE